MKMSEKLEKKFNEQIQGELEAGYLYLSMAAWFESKNLPGCARWMRAQSTEELGHAMKIFDYLLDRGSRAVLLGIPEPAAEFGSALDAFKSVLEHEKKVSAKISELYRSAMELEDFSSAVFLQWFVNEQVEEEKTAEDIIAKLKMVREDSAGMLALDNQLGSRG